MARAALDQAITVLGPEHPDTLIATTHLGIILRLARKYAEAEPLLERAVALSEQILGPEDPRTLNRLSSLAGLYKEQGQLVQAEAIMRKVIAGLRAAYGEGNPKLLFALNNLGLLLVESGKFSEAEETLRTAVELTDQSAPPEHWFRWTVRVSYGECLLATQRFEEAERTLLESYHNLEKILGPQHQRTSEAAAKLAELYETWGKPEQAAEYLTEPRRTRRRKGPEAGTPLSDRLTKMCSRCRARLSQNRSFKLTIPDSAPRAMRSIERISTSFVARRPRRPKPMGGANMSHRKFVITRTVILSGLIAFCGYIPSSARGQCELMKLSAPDPNENDYFGLSVAIAGEFAVVGMMNDDDNGANAGAAMVYRLDGVDWILDQQLRPIDVTGGEQFGHAVAISGNAIVVGALNDDVNGVSSGSAYVYRYSDASWHQEQKLTPDDGEAYHYFGKTVAIAGDCIVVGAYGDDQNGNDAGAAYVFNFVDDHWTQVQKIVPGDGEAADNFGYALDLADDTLVVGAYRDSDNGTYAGSVYIFRYEATSWTQQQKLLPEDAAAGDRFGYAVSVLAGRIAIGATHVDDNGTDSGAAYVFDYVDPEWIQSQKLLASDGVGGDHLAEAVALTADMILVGAPYDDNETGSVYTFGYQEPSWIQQEKITASDSVTNERFGVSIATDNNRAMVGAYKAAVDDVGAVYVFDLAGADCNFNHICDYLDISSGESEDCNANEIPDECDIAGQTSEDCTQNGIPDECEPDCNNNGRADTCDIHDGTSLDCNGNDIPDDCDIADCVDDATCYDCDENGVPDGCEYEDPNDCDENHIIDDCEVAHGICEDCNANGEPDGCDVREGVSEDCNGNEVPDECEVYFFTEASPTFEPLGEGYPQSYTIISPPSAGYESNVEMSFEAIGDLAALTEWVDVNINGTAVGRVFMNDAHDCPSEPDLAILAISAELYNQAIADGDAVINMVASAAVDPDWCSSTYITVSVQYQAIGDGDCNGNGVPDICDVLSGSSQDLNGNEIPDECEPECLGDLDGDNDIDLADLAELLGHYGTTSGADYEDGDLDEDGDVDLADLAALLGVYGDTCG